MSTIALRPVSDADFDFLFSLHEAALGPYVDQIWGWDDEEQRAHLRRNLDLDRARVIVVDGVDAGRLDVQEEADEVFIALVELTPGHQCLGIGGRLIRGLLDRAHADGKRVALSVLGVNERAYALYRRLGFTEVSRDGDLPEVRIRMVAEPAVNAR